MLLAINEKIKGWLGGVIIALIALPFALWGIQSYIGGGEEQIAASVDDREISLRELDKTASLLRQEMQSRSQLPPSDIIVKKRALDQLVNTTVLEQASFEQGYRISDAYLAAKTRQIFSRDGKFDKDYFIAALQSQGMTPAIFEQRYRSELRVSQMRDAIMTPAIVSDADTRKIIELQKQEREFRWLKLNIDKLASDVTVTDDEIETYYKSRQNQFMTPQQVSIEYVELTPETLSDVSIDESQIEGQYQEYVASAKQREERKARHILIAGGDDKGKVRETLVDIQKKLQQGEDFAALAKQHSDDPGSAEQGGDLGWVETGQMVKPFEDALYKLKKGETSDIVETEFGYHLIRLDDVRGVKIKPLAEMRDELVEKLKKEAADNALYEMSEVMATTAYENPDSLDAVAQAVSQPVKTSELFTRSAGVGIAENDAVRKAAFSSTVLQQGENSDLIEVAPNHVLVLRVKQNVEAAPVPLETVKNTIAETLRITKGQQAVSKVADDIIAKLKQGAAVKDVLQDGVDDQGSKTVSNKTQGDLDMAFVREVMTMAPPAEGKPSYKAINMGTGDVAVGLLDKGGYPQTVTDEEMAAIKSRFKRARATEDFALVLDALKAKADIYINKKVFEQE